MQTPQATENAVCKKCSSCLDGLTFVKTKCSAKADAECSVCNKCSGSELAVSKCTTTADTKCMTPNHCSEVPVGAPSKDYTFKYGKVFCMHDAKIGKASEKDKGWALALNIHPNDGHNAAWSASPATGSKMGCGGHYSWPANKCGW